MNENQDLNQAPVDDRFAQAQNPQVPGGQSLSAPTGNVQSTVNLQDASNQLSITSVGDSTFKPFDPNTSSTVLVAKPKPVNHHYGVIISSGVVIIACLLAVWLMSRKTKGQLKKS